jgi:hypothetical protein
MMPIGIVFGVFMGGFASQLLVYEKGIKASLTYSIVSTALFGFTMWLWLHFSKKK